MGNRQPLFNDRYPDDVIGLILMNVDILTLSSCPRICRQFARVLRSQYFWECKLKTKDDHRKIIHRLTVTDERKKITHYALTAKFQINELKAEAPSHSGELCSSEMGQSRRLRQSGTDCSIEHSVKCINTMDKDSADFAESIGLKVKFNQVTHETLNICRYCGSSYVRIADAHARCRECGHLASEWEKRRLTLSKYTIWKQLDYRFPYD